jgi:hypothetical protein
VILTWLQLPLILMVSILYFTFHMCCISVVRSLYFRIFIIIIIKGKGKVLPITGYEGPEGE